MADDCAKGSHRDELLLVPIRGFSLEGQRTTSDMLRQMAETAFTGRTLGEAADLLESMLRDPDCIVVLTISGAMTMAGLGGLLRESIRRRWVDCVVATGALVGHGLVENLGLPHYKADPRISDEVYYQHRFDRVYDTLEPEDNLNQMEQTLRGILDEIAEHHTEGGIGTVSLLENIGRRLPGDGILQAAAQCGVPVLIPAFTDSELGLDFAVHCGHRHALGKPALSYDAFRDLEFFREFCERHVNDGKRLGLLTIGGGVPRNWAQQVGPYVDIRKQRLGIEGTPVRYSCGIRICPDPPHFGHLSGCTYSEGVSWGKFVSPSAGGRYAEVLLDATVGWPILASAMADRGL
jgi:deoxyhypusine synthase